MTYNLNGQGNGPYFLSSTTQTPATVTGVISVASDIALLVSIYSGYTPPGSVAHYGSLVPGMVTNAGTIESASATEGSGIVMETGVSAGTAGGYIDNTSAGVIAGNYGVQIEDGIGTVTNAGRITGRAAGAVYLADGGSVINQTGGTIVAQGAGNGVDIEIGAGFISNAGLISNTSVARNAGRAVYLKAGGVVVNSATGTIVAGNEEAVYSLYDGISLFNAGLIEAARAVGLVVGGTVTNAAGGTILGSLDAAIYVSGTMASLIVNQQGGTIVSQATVAAIEWMKGTADIVNAGLIAGTAGNGIKLRTGGLVQNLATGTITSPAAQALLASGLTTVKNAGLINTGGTVVAVSLSSGGVIDNQSGATITSTGAQAIILSGTSVAPGTLLNFGTITTTGSQVDAVDIMTGFYVDNGTGGYIDGTNLGLNIAGPGGTVMNAGSIVAANKVADTTPVGVQFGSLAVSPNLTNALGGVITGVDAVASLGTFTAILNDSTLLGGLAGIYLSNGGQVVNQGGGTIAASGIVPGNAMATAYGIKVGDTAGTISNAGTIVGRNDGVLMSAGGTLKNQVDGSIGIIIQVATPSYADIKLLGTIASTILNAGTIGAVGPIPVSGGMPNDLTGVDGATGVLASGGLYLTNLNTGLIAGAYGIHSTSGPVAITNFGTILENHNTPITVQDEPAISISGTGDILAYVSNAASGIISAYSTGLAFSGVAGTVVNAGTFLSAARFSAGGTLVNQSGGIFLHTSIVGGFSPRVPTTVINAGTLAQSSVIAYGTVANQSGATISDYRYGIYLSIAGAVFNAGTISQTGTYFDSAADNNRFAAIRNNLNVAALSSIYINNASTGLIYGASIGVYNGSGPSTILNSGTINGKHRGVSLYQGGIVTNTAGAKISSIQGPILSPSLNSTLVNAGSIQLGRYIRDVVNQPGGYIGGIADNEPANPSTNQDTIVNAGVIGGGNGGNALSLNSGANDLLVVDPGASFIGAVNGYNALGSTHVSTLELAAGTGDLVGLGTSITNFGSIKFDPGAAWAIEGNSSGLAGLISGFAAGDFIEVDGFVTQNSSYLNGNLALTSAANGMITLDLPGSFTINDFIIGGDGTGGTGISIACFLAGTRIGTPQGEIAIEQLTTGDSVITASGHVRPIRWIGRRSYTGRFLAGNPDVLPILIRADALAEFVPRRDLLVSPKHALFLDGVLIPAELLVNGASVVQIDDVDSLTYYHIELDSHDILFAEGAPSESFIDHDSRLMFENAPELLLMRPAQPRMQDCAPRVEHGDRLERIRRRTATRAGLAADHVLDGATHGPVDGRIDILDRREVSGWAFDAKQPHTPLLLEITDGDRVIGQALANRFRPDLKQAGKGDGRCAYIFRFEAPQADLRRITVRRASDGAVLPPAATIEFMRSKVSKKAVLF